MSRFIRILVCRDCRTIETLPDYAGPVEADDTLAFAAGPHESKGHLGNLVTLQASAWADPVTRDQIMQQLTRKGPTGLPAEVYETKANAMDDAMSCWRMHLRPEDSCPDYWADSKILTPDTAELRRDLDVMKRDANPEKEVRLCQFCPIHVKMLERKKLLRGLYK